MCSIQVQIRLKYWFLRVLEPKISPRICQRSDLNPGVKSWGNENSIQELCWDHSGVALAFLTVSKFAKAF